MMLDIPRMETRLRVDFIIATVLSLFWMTELLIGIEYNRGI